MQRHCLSIQKLSLENQSLVALKISKECQGWQERSFLRILAAKEGLRRLWPYCQWDGKLVTNDREKTQALCLFATTWKRKRGWDKWVCSALRREGLEKTLFLSTASWSDDKEMVELDCSQKCMKIGLGTMATSWNRIFWSGTGIKVIMREIKYWKSLPKEDVKSLFLGTFKSHLEPGHDPKKLELIRPALSWVLEVHFKLNCSVIRLDDLVTILSCEKQMKISYSPNNHDVAVLYTIIQKYSLFSFFDTETSDYLAWPQCWLEMSGLWITVEVLGSNLAFLFPLFYQNIAVQIPKSYDYHVLYK